MLDMHKDRLSYGQLLECPPGYRLSFALGTTYSLDLEALMAVYVALGFSVDTDSAVGKWYDGQPADQLRCFAALSAVRDKVLVFCEKGKVRSSKEYNRLYSQIESSIIEVDLEGDDYPSFHPKLWILRFKEEKADRPRVKYRVCVLSRNVSFDSSWDVAGALEGEFDDSLEKRTRGGATLEEAVQELAKLAKKVPGASTGIKRVKEIAQELGKTRLRAMKQAGAWKYVQPVLFSDPWSKGNKSLHEVMKGLFATCARALVMTPFLSDTKDNNPVYELFHEGVRLDKTRSCVVVRRDALLGRESVAPWLQGLPIYTMRGDLASLNLAYDDEGESASTGFARSDIHAKLFVFEEPVGDGSTAASKTHLFFGSANATRRGMVTNWETMIHLESTQPQAFDKLLGDLGLGDDSHGAESFFERLSQDELKTLLADEPSSGDAQVDRDFDHFLRRLRGTMSLEGNESKDGSSYDVCVKLGVPDTGPNLLPDVEVRLLSSQEQLKSSEKAGSFIIRDVRLEDLTEFVTITYTDTCANDGKTEPIVKRGLIRCVSNKGLREILEQRRKALFLSFCAKSKQDLSEQDLLEQGLLDYLNLRLSNNMELDSARMSSFSRGGGMSNCLSVPLDSLYEKLIKAYADDPERANGVVEECLDYVNASEAPDICKLLKVFQDGTKENQGTPQRGGRYGER